MITKTTAITVAAASASFIVIFLQGFTSQVVARAAAVDRPACTESWPFYEASCLRDDRQPEGKARAVRIVSADRLAPAGSGRNGR